MEQEAHIDLKRNELAQHFGCAPSQINYVLATRFSIDHGYVIESRRGGGGYVRIVRMRESAGENLLSSLIKRVGSAIEEDAAAAIIAFVLERGIITPREGRLMCAATKHAALALPVSAKDVLRASILRNMLVQAFRNSEGGEGHDV
jgi:transcriptional regulator CtsR